MMLIIMTVIGFGVMFLSIQAFNAMPIFIKRLMVKMPLLAFLFNLLLSVILTSLIGVGMYAGAGNLLGSVVFAIYVSLHYKKLIT